MKKDKAVVTKAEVGGIFQGRLLTLSLLLAYFSWY
jgi:hypothetical protein